MPSGKYWTEEELEFLEKNAGKLTVDKLAKRLGRTKLAVQSKIAREAGNIQGMNGYMSLSEVAKEYGVSRGRLVTLVNQGVLPARKFGKVIGGVRYMVDPTYLPPIEHKLRLKKEPARGALSGRAKLTDADVLSIRKRYRNGDMISVMAKEHGTSWNVIKNAAVGRTWKHLNEKNWWEKR
jgi:hypothetical protein